MSVAEKHLYTAPLSEETRKLRRNCLIAAVICIFFTATGEIPEKVPLLGIELGSPRKQAGIPLLILLYASYTLVHFISSGAVDFGKWFNKAWLPIEEQKYLSKLPFYDDTPTLYPSNTHDRDILEGEALWEAKVSTEYKSRHALRFVNLKLGIELIVPLIVSICGIVGVLVRKLVY